jgi:Tfp pilus assembly protein PilV
MSTAQGKNKSRYRHCFTIAEVVVASLLLTVAMVPILQALTASHELDMTIEYKTHCLVLAKAKLEEIKADSIYNYDYDFSEETVSIEGAYELRVLDEDFSPANNNLRQITIYAGYDKNHNSTFEDAEIEVAIRTFLARRW